MVMADYSFGDLRVLRAVAACGSFTAAAAELGYTQSAISKRVAVLERTTGHTLVIRERKGVRLTPAGEVLLGHAAAALESMEAAERELDGADAVQVGPFGSARLRAPPLVWSPMRSSASHANDPGSWSRCAKPQARSLVRALRAGNLELALLAGMPPLHAAR